MPGATGDKLDKHPQETYSRDGSGRLCASSIATVRLWKKRILIICDRPGDIPFEQPTELLKTYRITKVLGDHYGGEFVKEPFRKHGISYEVCKTPKSDLFRDLLPLLNSGHITLPRHDRLIARIVGLERRTARGGRDSIDHAPGATTTSPMPWPAARCSRQPFYDPFMGCGGDDDPDGSKSCRRCGFGHTF